MCVLDTRRFRFTLKKIPVYKVVVERDTHYRSPYKGGFISKGLPFIQKGITNNSPYYIKYYKYYEYGPGFVFAFASKSMAELRKFRLEVEDEFNFFNENIEMHHFVILEGYIPAFTRYAIDSSKTEICARKMVFTKVLQL